MTLEELARHDGKEGRKAYVAVDGKIYDFTESSWWANGHHEGRHQAGSDLTESLRSAPHFRSLIERYPVVDVLSEHSSSRPSRSWQALAALLVFLLLLVIFWMVRG